MNWFIAYKKASTGNIIAYHTTIAGNSIMQSGFKSRKDLSGKAALGGGTDNSISFTTDWAVAKGIYDAFILATNIANAENPLEFIKTHFYSLSPKEQTSVASMLNSIHGKQSDKNINDLFSGMIIDGTFDLFNNKKPLTKEELDNLNYIPIDEDVNGKYYAWKRPLTSKEINDLLYSYLKTFHSGANVYNPVFFGTDITNFKNVSKDNIGIITAEINIDPNKRTQDDYNDNASFRYVSSMAEIRVFDISIIHILDFDNKPGNKPKHNSTKNYYSNSTDRENAIHEFLQYIYKNYNKLNKFFTENDLAIDAIIAMVQYYGESKSELWQIINSIENSCKLKHSQYILEQYLRYYNKIKLPKYILQHLTGLPEDIKNRILNGEKSDDVLFEWYENNKNEYDQWYDSKTDIYNIESELSEWSRNRKHDLNLYKTYGEQNISTLKELFGDNDYNVIHGLILVLNKVKKVT